MNSNNNNNTNDNQNHNNNFLGTKLKLFYFYSDFLGKTLSPKINNLHISIAVLLLVNFNHRYIFWKQQYNIFPPSSPTIV